VQVLDDERIVEIDDCRNRMRVLEKRVCDVALNDRHVVSLAGGDERFERLGAATFHGARIR